MRCDGAQAPVRTAARSSPPWLDRTGPARGVRLVAGPATSGSTPCSRRSPTSAPPAGRASRSARHARTRLSALAAQRHNDQFGTQWKRSSEGGTPDHNGGSRVQLTAADRIRVKACAQDLDLPGGQCRADRDGLATARLRRRTRRRRRWRACPGWFVPGRSASSFEGQRARRPPTTTRIVTTILPLRHGHEADSGERRCGVY
jgi:hypothetical protein